MVSGGKHPKVLVGRVTTQDKHNSLMASMHCLSNSSTKAQGDNLDRVAQVRDSWASEASQASSNSRVLAALDSELSDSELTDSKISNDEISNSEKESRISLNA